MTNLQKLKKAIIKEIPERTEHEGVICYECKKKLKLNGYGLYTVTIITLADVLIVLGEDYLFGAGDKYFYQVIQDINGGDTQEVEMVRPGIKWYANKDLSLQSGKTIRWLTKIICKNE